MTKGKGGDDVPPSLNKPGAFDTRPAPAAKPPRKRAKAAKAAPPSKPPRKRARPPRAAPAAAPADDGGKVIRPAAWASRQAPPADQAPPASAKPSAPLVDTSNIELAQAAIGLVRADIIARLVDDGTPLDRARQFTDLFLEYAQTTEAIDRLGVVQRGVESAWAVRRDKVRKALESFRTVPADWLWERLP